MQALTIGHKSNISTRQWQVLRNTGTSHLMAISGLHIGLVAGLVFFLVRKLVPVWLLRFSSAAQFAAIISLLVAGFYALLAGFSVPTQRAFIMLLVFMSAILLKRPAFSINTLSLALIAVLLINPVSVLSVGFWLSFVAVIIIALVSSSRIETKPGIQASRLPGWLSGWVKGIRIQWLIALGMLPLSVLLFQQGSIISPIANMLVIPLVGMLVVPMALIASFTSVFSAEISSWLFTQASMLLSFVWLLLDWLAQSPFASWQRSAVPMQQSILALSGGLLLLMPRGFPLRYSGIILLLPMLFYVPAKPARGDFWITVLDVGQGLSVLIETSEKALIYDTGARFSDRFDIGQRVVIPYLQYIGVQQIDTLMISHGDNDHAGGADSILQMAKVKKVLGEADAIKSHQQDGVMALPCKAGISWSWNMVSFEVLHPQKKYSKTNNRSCVLKVWNDQYSLLLTGDIELKAEKHLLKQQQGKLTVDVLLVPHHGSNTSSSANLLEALKPGMAIVSAGYNNRFGHPTQKVLRRYSQLGIRVLNTAYDGAIQIKFEQSASNEPLQALRQRKRDHYWNHRF